VRGGIFVDTGSVRVRGKRKKERKKEKQDYGGRKEAAASVLHVFTS
jgi:hypothetical protein